MRTVSAFLATVTIFSAFPTSSVADGNDLLQQCISLDTPAEKKDVANSFDSGMCLGLVTGTLNTLHVLVGNDGSKSLCLPESVKTKEATKAVVTYLKNNQKYLHEHEVTLIIRALLDAYPCK